MSSRASNTLRAGRVVRFGRDEQLAPSRANITPRSEGTPHPARRVHRTSLGGYTAPRSEGTSHSERDGQLCLIPVINNFRPGKKSLAFSV